MIQHPLPSNCKFYVESHPPILDINSHLQILCYTSHAKERSINYKIDWRKRVHGQFVPVTNVQGNTYTCGANDLGAYINAEITSMDPVHSGTTVLQFGPVTSPMPLSVFSTAFAAGMGEPSNQPPTFSGRPFNELILPPMSQTLPQIFAQAAQNFIPANTPPPINNHTVFLIGNGAQRQCDLKFTQHGMRIKDISTDYCYKFRVNKKGPRFQHNISEVTKIHVTFDHKYVSDLSKFLRSFDDNRFVIILGERGSGIIQLRFPTKERKETFMEACESILVEDAEKQRVESAEVLFKTSVYEPIKAVIDLDQEHLKPSHPQTHKISMTNYSGVKKQSAKRKKVEDYTQGSLLTWMDNILMKDKLVDVKRESIDRQNQLRMQTQIVQKQLEQHQRRSVDRQRERIFNHNHNQNRRVTEQSNNIINLTLALNQLRKQNQQLQHQNVRLALNQQTDIYNFESYQSQLRVKEGVISDAYSQLSTKQACISNLSIENEKLSALYKQAERRVEGYVSELAELKASEFKVKEYYSSEIRELQQEVFGLREKERENEERVGSGVEVENARLAMQVSKLEEERVRNLEEIKEKEGLLLMRSSEIERIKSSHVSYSETESILRAEIIELRHQLEQKVPVADKSPLQLSRAKARILQLQTLLKQKQTILSSPPIQIPARHQLLLKEKQNQIMNLQAQIQMFRMKQHPSHHASNLIDAPDSQPSDTTLRNEYQNLMSIRNMLQSKCQQLLFQNYELRTNNQKLDFQIKYLQGQKQSPEVEEYRVEIERMNNYIDEQEQKMCRLDNQYEQYKLMAQRKEAFSLDQISRLEERLRMHSDHDLGDSNHFAVGSVETLKRQNSMLVGEMEILNKNCKKLRAEAETVPKLTSELAELRRRLLEATEENYLLRNSKDRESASNIMDSSLKNTIVMQESRRIAVSEILND